jgi:hypothetical protein
MEYGSIIWDPYTKQTGEYSKKGSKVNNQKITKAGKKDA